MLGGKAGWAVRLRMVSKWSLDLRCTDPHQDLRARRTMFLNPAGLFLQAYRTVGDVAVFENLPLGGHQQKTVLASGPVQTDNERHRGLRSVPKCGKGQNSPFVSGIPMKALSVWAGDSVSAVGEWPAEAGCPFWPSRGRKCGPCRHPVHVAWWGLFSPRILPTARTLRYHSFCRVKSPQSVSRRRATLRHYRLPQTIMATSL